MTWPEAVYRIVTAEVVFGGVALLGCILALALFTGFCNNLFVRPGNGPTEKIEVFPAAAEDSLRSLTREMRSVASCSDPIRPFAVLLWVNRLEGLLPQPKEKDHDLK